MVGDGMAMDRLLDRDVGFLNRMDGMVDILLSVDL
jgi:hypothetical protein